MRPAVTILVRPDIIDESLTLRVWNGTDRVSITARCRTRVSRMIWPNSSGAVRLTDRRS